MVRTPPAASAGSGVRGGCGSGPSRGRLSIDNQSEYVLRSLDIYVQIRPSAGEGLYESGLCLREGSSDFRILPEESEEKWCALHLSSEASALITDAEHGDFDWRIDEVKGHRLPFRIVKGPLDWLSSLFERVPE